MTDKSSFPGTIGRLDLEHTTRPEFINAMVHLYRGELGEATAWRSRIDATTNWAVVLSATALTFVFSDNSSEHHVLIPIITFFCTFFMLIEARRYRFFDIWRTRACMLEINFYRPMLDGSKAAMPDWAETLSHDMEWPHFHMPLWEAVGRRLRRNYQYIYAVLLDGGPDVAPDLDHLADRNRSPSFYRTYLRPGRHRRDAGFLWCTICAGGLQLLG